MYSQYTRHHIMRHKNTEQHPVNWLKVAFILALFLWLGTAILGSQREFWYDEVFTLGASGINGSLDWDLLLRDVHPPTFTLLVAATSQLTGDDLHSLRAVNILGLPAILIAFFIMRKRLAPNALLLLSCLYIGNFLTLYMTTELRSYFLLLAVTTLGQALLFARIKGNNRMDIWLFPVALIMTSLHLFGAAMATAMLGASALHHFLHGRVRRASIVLAGGFICTALISYWAFGIAETAGAMGGKMWITNSPDHYLVFLATQIVTVLTALVTLVFYRLNPTLLRPKSAIALWMLLPVGLTLSIAILFSFHTPIVSPRNLIVLVPGLTLSVTLYAGSFHTTLARSPLTAIVFLVFAGINAQRAIADRQFIAWAAKTATKEHCSGVPIYTMNPDIIDRFAQVVFTGEYNRPVRDILDIKDGFDTELYSGDCKVFAMVWHEHGGVDNVENFLEQLKIPAKVRYPNYDWVKEKHDATHGFVVEYTPN